MFQITLQEVENCLKHFRQSTQNFLSVSPAPKIFQIEIPIFVENSVDRESDLLLFKSSLTKLPVVIPTRQLFALKNYVARSGPQAQFRTPPASSVWLN